MITARISGRVPLRETERAPRLDPMVLVGVWNPMLSLSSALNSIGMFIIAVTGPLGPMAGFSLNVGRSNRAAEPKPRPLGYSEATSHSSAKPEESTLQESVALPLTRA